MWIHFVLFSIFFKLRCSPVNASFEDATLLSLRSQNRRIWGTLRSFLGGRWGCWVGSLNFNRMDSSRRDSTPVGAVHNLTLSRSRLTANRGPSFLYSAGRSRSPLAPARVARHPILPP